MRVNEKILFLGDTYCKEISGDVVKMLSLRKQKQLLMDGYDKLVTHKRDNGREYIVSNYMMDAFVSLSRLRTNPQTQDIMYCPECHKMHAVYEYFHPYIGFENLVRKYAEEVFISYVKSYCMRMDDKLFTSFFYDIRKPEQILVYGIKMDNSIQEEKKCSIWEKEYFVPENEFLHDDKGIVVKCPSCGFRFPTDFQFRPNHFSTYLGNECRTMFLHNGSNWYDLNRRISGYYVFSDEDSPIVRLSVLVKHYYPNKTTLHVETSVFRFAFNTQTGMSYSFHEIDKKTKKPIIKGAKRLVNITYRSLAAHIGKISEEAAKELVAAICKKKNIACPEQFDKLLAPYPSDSLWHSTRILDICSAINRYGAYGKDFIYSLITIMESKYLNRKTLRFFKDMINSNEIFAQAIKAYDIKGKKRVSLVAKNPMNMVFDCATRYDLCITNPDSIIKVLENHETMTKIFREIHNWVPPFDKRGWRYSCDNYIQTFCKQYVRVKSDVELANKLIALSNSDLESERIFIDTCSTFDTLSNRIPFTDEALKRIFQGSIVEIHDRLSEIYNSYRYRDEYIPYYEEELQYNCFVDGYEFSLAKTTGEMKQVGSKMHICVGTYGTHAISKSCSIVFMKERATGTLAACIEISPTNKLVQVKDYCNNSLEVSKIPAFKAFVINNNIIFADCYDAERISLCSAVASDSYERNEDTSGYSIFKKGEELKAKPSLEAKEQLSKFGITL